jgi:hypothetical protein
MPTLTLDDAELRALCDLLTDVTRQPNRFPLSSTCGFVAARCVHQHFPPMLRPPCFAHVAYRFQECFAARKTGLRSVEVRTREELDARIGGAHVLVVSGLWRNDLVKIAPNLRFVQSISVGVDQYSAEMLKASGIRLASAQ